MTTLYFKKILITGAASGIGKLMAENLARLGAVVILVDLNEAAGIKVCEEIVRNNGKAYFFPADLSNTQSILTLKEKVHESVGAIDILINNAGVVFGGEFEKSSLQKHLLTYRVNVDGLVTMTHTFFEDLKKSPESHIVNIASASGLIGLPYGTTYASSKWAVIGFSESLRLEIKERNLNNMHVTTICPSYIATGMFEGVKAPILIPWLKPNVIVNKIIDGIRANKAFVQEPFIVKTVELLRGILPLPIFDFVSKLLGVSTSMQHWKGRSH